jgi:hypothetical protein
MDFISLFVSAYSFIDFATDTTQYRYFKLLFAIYSAPNAIYTLFTLLSMGQMLIPYIIVSTVNNFMFHSLSRMYVSANNYLKDQSRYMSEFENTMINRDTIIEYSFDRSMAKLYNKIKNKEKIKGIAKYIIEYLKEKLYIFVLKNLYSDGGLITINNPCWKEISVDVGFFRNYNPSKSLHFLGINASLLGYDIMTDSYSDFYNYKDEICSNEFEKMRIINNSLPNNDKIYIKHHTKVIVNNNEHMQLGMCKTEKEASLYLSYNTNQNKICYLPIFHKNPYDESMHYKFNYVIVKGKGDIHIHKVNEKNYEINGNCHCEENEYSLKIINFRREFWIERSFLIV